MIAGGGAKRAKKNKSRKVIKGQLFNTKNPL